VTLGIVTADCAPVLFADPTARVIGAAHAGWRGAVAGVLEATVAAMLELGATRGGIRAAIGPCIGPRSYEVGPDVRDAALAASPDEAAECFEPGRADRWWFALAEYCRLRLRCAGIEDPGVVVSDTLAEPDLFFSHRRRTLAGGGPIGHQISLIGL
jgi:YfiH family protein